MSTIMPQSDRLKKAIEWISEQRKAESDRNLTALADEAAFRFDLSPKDGEFLLRFLKEGPDNMP